MAVFGSARTPRDDPDYIACVELAIDCYQRRGWEATQRAAADPMTGRPPDRAARPEHAGAHTDAPPEQ